jgi:N-acetylneuraminic acid mutarotase
MRIRQHFCCGSLLVLGVFIAAATIPVAAQPAGANEWTWMGGSNTIGNTCTQVYFCGQVGIYGTQGTPSKTNIPGGRYSGATWTDSSGHLWLFGGSGFDSAGNNFFLNDLWLFDPSSDEWTWIGGSNLVNQAGVYGTLGVPSDSNVPGARSVAATWTDKNGNFWLFGGWGMDANGEYSALSDLWRFTPATGQWTWEGGNTTINQPGVYGTLGSSSSINKPGGRYEASSWTDSSGNLWLFGGYDDDANGVLDMANDLWQFDPSTGEWTWMRGNDTTGTACPTGQTVFCGWAGVYGTMGTPSASNSPGSRNSAVNWTDANGHFWLAFGLGYDSAGAFGSLDDIWMFDPSSHQWTWMGGSDTIGAGAGHPGVYGTLGSFNASNLPGSGCCGSPFVDSAGNLWLFSGWGVDSQSNPGLLNDVWEYSTQLNEWAWMAGNNTAGSNDGHGHSGWPGIYGSLGVAAPGNAPGGREAAMNWSDGNGNFWLFGGAGFDSTHTWGYLNDLWEYSLPATVLPQAATPIISSSNPPPSLALTVTISDATPGATINYTTNGTTPTTGSDLYSGPITVSSNETLEAIATASGYSTSAVATATYLQTAAPTFSPAGGNYSSAQNVTVSDSTPGAAIFCSFANSSPPPGPNNCDSPLMVSQSATVNAYAVAPGYAISDVSSATYTIPSDFLLTINPASISVQAGQSGTATLTVTDEGGFNGNVSFACSGLPAGAACSFALETLPTNSDTTYTRLTVTTSAETAARRRNSSPLIPAGALAAVLCCFGWKRRRWHMFLLMAISAIGLSVLNGCNASFVGVAVRVQPQTSTITVTATSGSLQHAATFSLTVN